MPGRRAKPRNTNFCARGFAMRDRGLRVCRDFVACTRVLSRTPRALRDGAGRIACSCVARVAHDVCVRVHCGGIVAGAECGGQSRVMASCCASLRPGRRAAGGMCGRDAVAEPPGEAASRGEAGSGVAEERGRSDVQQQTCMCFCIHSFLHECEYH